MFPPDRVRRPWKGLWLNRALSLLRFLREAIDHLGSQVPTLRFRDHLLDLRGLVSLLAGEFSNHGDLPLARRRLFGGSRLVLRRGPGLEFRSRDLFGLGGKVRRHFRPAADEDDLFGNDFRFVFSDSLIFPDALFQTP